VIQEGDVLWCPSAEQIERAQLTRYRRWLEANHGLRFADYQELWRWSVEHLEAFWETIWQFFELRSPAPYGAVLARRAMPGARWFPGARLNFSREIFGRASAEGPILHYLSETRDPGHLTRAELAARVAAVARGLRSMGVGPGDRVVGYLPNLPETAIGLLATASLGAIWSCCSPDFGCRTVLDRFRQLEPTVLLGLDGYRYGGRDFDRRDDLAAVARGLPSVKGVVALPYRFGADRRPLPGCLWWHEAFEGRGAELDFADTGFEDPLWVVFTSGTTGPPKGIVHGHGGVVVELLKSLVLHGDLGPDSTFFFHTTAGWINFNVLVAALMTGARVVLYDGHPAHPEPDLLWRIADRYGVTALGASPAYVQLMLKMNVRPRERLGLERLGAIACTGSHVAPEHFEWFYRQVKPDLAVRAASGGTEVATAFLLGAPTEPVRAGEMQVRGLGLDVRAFDPEGRSVVDQVGELVVTQPMPSMPLRFWNDPEDRRYRATYFDAYPGVWRHGDLLKLTERGSGVIYGRSDSTLNRDGVRIGSGEIYRIVESLPEVRDSLVVNVDGADGRSLLLLFVALAGGLPLTPALAAKVAALLKREGSPRHVFDRIESISAVPYTLTGKKLEVPLKRILAGVPVDRALSRDALADPDALEAMLPVLERLRQELGPAAAGRGSP
jgi:acetoacetyl-CoA synthetase